MMLSASLCAHVLARYCIWESHLRIQESSNVSLYNVRAVFPHSNVNIFKCHESHSFTPCLKMLLQILGTGH